jgi:large-conductance mechanosensitive channel
MEICSNRKIDFNKWCLKLQPTDIFIVKNVLTNIPGFVENIINFVLVFVTWFIAINEIQIYSLK